MLKRHLRSSLALLLCELLILLPLAPARSRSSTPPTDSAAAAQSLHSYLLKSYLELFELAPHVEFSSAEIENERKALEGGKDHCVKQFKERTKQYDDEMGQAQKDLKRQSASLSNEQRHEMHCRIQNLRELKGQAALLAEHGVPVAYNNMKAKLELIEKWPALYRQTKQEIASGSYQNRQWGDVKDIGFRQIAKGQEDDIKTGQDAIRQMKKQGLIPPDLDDKAIEDYVNAVAQRVAAHSDLHVPLHVTVLNSKEINAFALPGGYLFVERGLLEAADDESELAGVLGHEISHDVARHANKLMKRATIASIFYQGAEVAAVLLTGGIASIGLYYALQYGFYGLGLVLDLRLLGVSREYELQADQLGIQYTWNSGYDPSGFIRFFDKIATKEGYVNGLSWFRTHPPFYQRMVDAQREILFLPKKPNLVVQTADFEKMKKELVPLTAKAENQAKNKPSLLAPEPNCPTPKKLEYTSGEKVEALCSAVNETAQARHR